MARDSSKDTGVAQVTQDDPEQANIQGAKLASQAGDEKIAGGRTDGPILTSEPKSSADKSSWPGGEAKPHDPPVRVARPDVPGVVALATGAGQHVPPSLDEYTPEGRPRDLPGSDE